MIHNPLIQRYRFSLLRPKQIGIYSFIYVSIVALILLLNYTVFVTLKPLLFLKRDIPFDVYQFIFYQFALFPHRDYPIERKLFLACIKTDFTCDKEWRSCTISITSMMSFIAKMFLFGKLFGR